MQKLNFRKADLFTVFIIAMLVTALLMSRDWPLRASILVIVLGLVGLALAIAQLVLDLRRPSSKAGNKPTYEVRNFNDADPALASKGSLEMWSWLVGLVCSIPVLGLPVTLTVFVFLYAKIYGASWKMAAFMGMGTALFIYGLYVELMDVYWPPSLLGRVFDFL